MHVPFAPSLQPRDAARGVRRGLEGAADAHRRVVAVERIGYLVPVADFDGDVHSIFARACNIASEGSLLTLAAHDVGDGPTTLRLCRDAPAELRQLFRAGDRVTSRGGYMRSPGAAFHFADAAVWRPAPPRPMVPEAQLVANLRFAEAALGRQRRRHSSVIDREASALLVALDEACRDLDVESALPPVARLIGWGEGLTPAGDDFLVGWCAALAALATGDECRVGFLRDVGVAIAARTARTTPIAAHCLLLATQGHFNADVHALRDALLFGHDHPRLQSALADALAVGSTSGADTVTGLLSGCSSWLDPRAER